MIDTHQQILDDWSMRFQDPSIYTSKGKHPKWQIRPVVPVLGLNGREAKQKVITLGRVGEMSRKQAEREKQRIMAEINGGQALINGQIKLREVVEKFQRSRLPLLAASTRDKYEAHLRNHVYLLGDFTLRELTPELLQSWLIGLKQKTGAPLAENTRTDVKNLLSAIFEQARRWRLWESLNPLRDVDLPKLTLKREKRIPTEEQVRRLLDALDCCGATADGTTGADVRLMVEVIIACGWRISEVLGLKHDAIRGEVIEMRRRWYRGDLTECGKTGASTRSNYIGPLAATLAARPGEFVFAGPPDDRALVQHILRPCAKAVGCYWEGFGFHSFRRLNNTWRQQAGATTGEVMRALGHTKPTMTAAYTVLEEERERVVVEKIRGRVQ